MKKLAAYILSLPFLPLLSGQIPDTVFLEDLTWTEVRTLIQGGTTTVLFPTGGIEQNGPHVVLGKHNFRVRYAAERIARKLGKTLVMPVVPYAPQGEFNLKFPGTIHFPDEYWRKLLEHGARSLQRHGFRDIVILSDSGSDAAKLTEMIDALNAEWSTSATRIYRVREYRTNGFTDWLLKQGESKADIGLHAGVLDTSLIWAVDPKHVRQSRLNDRDAFEGSVDGNPARASVAYGNKGLEFMIETTVERIRALKVSSRQAR